MFSLEEASKRTEGFCIALELSQKEPRLDLEEIYSIGDWS